MVIIDSGERCSQHAGEVFPPRCAECQKLTEAAELDARMERLARRLPTPGVMCVFHPDYPANPCLRCARDMPGSAVA